MADVVEVGDDVRRGRSGKTTWRVVGFIGMQDSLYADLHKVNPDGSVSSYTRTSRLPADLTIVRKRS